MQSNDKLSTKTKTEVKAAQMYDYIESLDIPVEQKKGLMECFHDTLQRSLDDSLARTSSALIEQGMKNFHKDLENSVAFEKFKKHTGKLIGMIEEVKDTHPEMIHEDYLNDYQEALFDLRQHGFDYQGRNDLKL